MSEAALPKPQARRRWRTARLGLRLVWGVWQLPPGSLQVRAGATGAAGERLGSVGNSGNTREPHPHLRAQRPGPAGAPFGGDPLPILFDGRYPVRGDRIESP